MMQTIKKIYAEDLYHMKRWEKKYTDKEFYAINRKLRLQLNKLLHAQKKISQKELWMSGVILHHGNTLISSRQALKYARQAWEQGYTPARTLIAQATDRKLQLEGKPQKFGTQAIRIKNGKWKIYKLDGTISDTQRKEHGLPTLKYLKEYLNK